MNKDRFLIKEYDRIQGQFSTTTALDQQQFGELLRRTEVTNVNAEGGDRLELTAIALRIHLTNSTLAGVGKSLTDLDIELRRSASFLFNGSTRPFRGSQMIEVSSALSMASIDVVILVTKEIYYLLTTRPVDFLLLLDWFWAHRHNLTKVRQPYEPVDPRDKWNDLMDLVRESLERGLPVRIVIEIGDDGLSSFRLEIA